MNKLEFATVIAESFSAAKTIVHQRQRSTPAEFRTRVQRLSVDFKAIENSEHWREWPRSPTVFGKYHRAGDCALHVGFMFAQCVFAATQFAKLQTVGMPKDLNKLTDSQLSDWMEATRNELESTTLELSQWSPGEILRDADLLVRQIAAEFELETTVQVADWREYNATDAMLLLSLKSYDTLGIHAKSQDHPYIEKIRNGHYKIDHSHPYVKGQQQK